MRIVAGQALVARMAATFQEIETTDGGWTTVFTDPSTGERWTRIYLGAEYHGGGMPVMVRQPMPDAAALQSLAAGSPSPSEVAAAAWLLADSDHEGTYKLALVGLAQAAADTGDGARAVLLVGWGRLDSEMNLRPFIGKSAADVTRDHEHFVAIATRARSLLQQVPAGWTLRDPSVFE